MLELRVLGSIDLVRGDGASVRSVLVQPKRTALLVYLAADRPGELHRRDTLLAAFWPERDEARARNALNQSLHFLRRFLGEDTIRTRGREEVGVDGEVLRCDAAAFQDALEDGSRERALELYRGDFLPGFHVGGAPEFERWADRRRERLRNDARDAAVRLAASAGDAAAARRWLERAFQIAPTDEEVARRLMELLDGTGDRAGALRIYDVLATRLERGLGLDPSPEVRELADGIRRREDVHPGAPADGEAAPPADTTASEGQPALDTAGPGQRADDEAAGVSEPGAAAGSERAGTPAGPARRRIGRWAAAAAAILAVGLALTVGPGLPDGAGSDGTVASPTEGLSLAVLPFDYLGPDSAGRYLADGLTEQITTSLARTGAIPVISRTSVMKYRERTATAREIARDLEVTHVVEGAVQRSGERMAVTAKLIDARTDRHVWARTWERKVVDLLDVQRAVAGAIARSLPLEIAPGAGEENGTVTTADPRAYELLLRGREYQTRTSGDPGDNNRYALRMFAKALERDSSFAEAWARSAESHLNLYQWSAERAERRVELAREAAERALAAEPGGPWGHWALADVHFRATRDPEATLRHLVAAEEAGLVTGEVVGRKAAVLRERGKLEEAAELYGRARALDPLNAGLIYESWFVHLGLRRYDEAEATLERVLELAPDHEAARRYLSRLPLLRDGDAEAVGAPASREWETLYRRGDLEAALATEGPPELPGNEGRTRARRGLVYLEMGDTAAARAAFDSARDLLQRALGQDTFTQALMWLGIARAGRGDEEGALEAGRGAVSHAERRHGVPSVPRFYLGLVQAMLGREEDAIATLESYLANPGARSFRNVATHPLVEPLRDHPGFRELQRRFGPGASRDTGG